MSSSGPRTPAPGTARAADAESIGSTPLDRSAFRSDAGDARPARADLDAAARDLSGRHTELTASRSDVQQRVPDAKQAAKELRAASGAEAKAKYWSAVRESATGQFARHPSELPGKNREILDRFAAFAATEAGVAKELPAIRTMISNEFSATVRGELNGAVKAVADDIVRRAGMPGAKFDPLVNRLGSSNRAEFVQAMDDFRDAIRDFRTQQARGGRYNPETQRPTTLDQGRVLFDADAKVAAYREARTIALQRNDAQSVRMANEAAEVRRQVETEARLWAGARDEEFAGVTKRIGNQYVEDVQAGVVASPRPRAEFRPGQDPQRALNEANAHLNARFEVSLRIAAAAERFRPDIDAVFNAEARTARNIAAVTRGRLGSIDSLSKEEAAQWRTSFRNSVNNEFERIWRPVHEGGHLPGSAKFEATQKAWADRLKGMREQLRIEGFVHHGMQRLTSGIGEGAAGLRGAASVDTMRAIEAVREEYRAAVVDMLRGIGRRGPDLARWDKLVTRLEAQTVHAFEAEAVAERGGAAGIAPARRGDTPAVEGKPLLGEQPAPPVQDPRLAAVRNQAIEDFRALDPQSLAKLPQSMSDQLGASYLHERLRAYDGITNVGSARVPDEVLRDLADEARLGSGRGPVVWTEYRIELTKVLEGRGLAVTPTSGGLVVHLDAGQAVADGALVQATRGMEEMPSGLRIVAGPGVRPEVDLVGLGRLAREGVVLHAPFLDDTALAAVSRSTGLTVAFKSRPASGEVLAHPVDGAGAPTLSHLAVEWRSGKPVVDAPFDLVAESRSGVYRLSGGWTLESHSWGVWARPPETSVADAFRVRLGELNGDRPVVVGVAGVDVPDAVVREIHQLAERMPTIGGRSGITWLSRPGRDVVPDVVDDLADPTTLARRQMYEGAFDLAETRRLVIKQAGRDFLTAELSVELPSSKAVGKLFDAYEADVEALFGKYLGGRNGWHGYADAVGFSREYDELRSSLSGRLDAQVRWEARAGELRGSAEETFRRHDAVGRDRAELFPTAGTGQANDAELITLNAVARADGRFTAFWDRWSETAAKEVDDAAKSGLNLAGAATVDSRITDLVENLGGKVIAYLKGDRALTDGLARSRAIGDEARAGVGGVGDEISSTLSRLTLDAYEKVFGEGGSFGAGHGKAVADPAELVVTRAIDKIVTSEQVAVVQKRVHDAYASLLRADPHIETSAFLDTRLALAHNVVVRLERAVVARVEMREAAGLRSDLTPGQLERFRDDLVRRVDKALFEWDGSTTALDGNWNDEVAAAQNARIERLTNDERLAAELDKLAEPHMVRFVRDDLMRRLDAVPGRTLLEDASVDRIGTRITTDLRRAFDDIFTPDRPVPAANEAWARKLDEFRAGLSGRVEGELDSLTNLRSAAQEFHTIEGAAAARAGAPARAEQVADLAAAHRADFLADRDFNLRKPTDRSAWLGHEQKNGDRYGSHLAELRRKDFFVGLERRLDVDLRAAVDRLGLRGVERAEPEAAAAIIKRSFVDEIRGAKSSVNSTSVWEKRYQTLSDSIDSQLTISMMERRVKAIADEAVTRHSVTRHAGDPLNVEPRRVSELVTKEFGAALRQRALGALPPSLGSPEQREVLAGMGPGVQLEVDRLLGAEGIGESARAMARAVVDQVSQQLSTNFAVPNVQQAGFVGERARAVVRLDEAIAEELGRQSRVPTASAWTASAWAASAAVVRQDVLGKLDELHEQDWNFDRNSWARQFDQMLSGIGRSINSEALRGEIEQHITTGLDHALPDALAALEPHSTSRRALESAGRAFRVKFLAEVRREMATSHVTLADKTSWEKRFEGLDDSFHSWVTTQLVGDRAEELVTRHVAGMQGIHTEEDAARLAQVEQRLQQAVKDVLAPYLTLSANAMLPPSIGVEEQVTLAGEIAARLDEAAAVEEVAPLGERVVESLRLHPVAALPGAGLAAERAALSARVDDELRDVVARHEPGELVQKAQSILTGRALGRFDKLADAGWAFDRGKLDSQVTGDLADADEFVTTYVRRNRDKAALPSVVQERLAEARRGLHSSVTKALTQLEKDIVEEFDRVHPEGRPYGDLEVAVWQARLDGVFGRVESWLVAQQVGDRAVASVGTADQAAVRQALRPYLQVSATSPLPASMGPREQESLGRALLADAAPTVRDQFAERLRAKPVPFREGNDFAARRARTEELLNAALVEAGVAVRNQAVEQPALRHLDGAIEEYRREVLATVDAAFERDWRAPAVSVSYQLITAKSAVTRRMIRAHLVSEMDQDLATRVSGPAAGAFRAAALSHVTASVAAGDEFGPAEVAAWRREYEWVLQRSQVWQIVWVLADRAHNLVSGAEDLYPEQRQRYANAIEQVVKPYLDLGKGGRLASSLGLREQERLAEEIAWSMPEQIGDLLRASVHAEPISDDPAWAGHFVASDFTAERALLEQRLLQEVPGTGVADEAFRAEQLRRFDAANEVDWDFNRATWNADLDQRLDAKADWISAWERTVDARREFGAGLDAALDAALEKLPASEPAKKAAQEFFDGATLEFEATYRPGIPFGDTQDAEWRQRLDQLIGRISGWLTVRQIGMRIADRIGETVLENHGPRSAENGRWDIADRMIGQVDDAVAELLDLRRSRLLPPTLGVQEQANLAAHLTRDVTKWDAEKIGLHHRPQEAARQWFTEEPVAVPAGDDVAAQRARLADELESVSGDDAAVTAFRTDVLRDFDATHARWWDLRPEYWQGVLDRRLMEAPTWIDAKTRWADARAGIASGLRTQLDEAWERLRFTIDDAATGAAEAALVAAVTDEFDRTYPAESVFEGAAQKAWAEWLGSFGSYLDAWLTIHTLTTGSREIMPATEAMALGNALRPYLDVNRIAKLPAVFGPAERDALMRQIADETIIEIPESLVSEMPVRDGVGFAVHRAALVDRLAEVLRPFRENSEADAAAAGAVEAFVAHVLSRVDATFAHDWNGGENAWDRAYEDAVGKITPWLDSWAEHDRRRSADRDALDRALNEKNANPRVRDAILAAFDRHYAGYADSVGSVTIASEHWQSRQSRILDGLAEHQRRTELIDRLAGSIDDVVASLSALWGSAGVQAWELDQLSELGERVRDGVRAALQDGALPDRLTARPVEDLTEQLDRHVGAWADRGLISPAVRALAAQLRAALVAEARDVLGEPESAPTPPALTHTRLTAPDFAADFRRTVLWLGAGPLDAHHVDLEKEFAAAGVKIFDRPSGATFEDIARGDYHDLIQEFRVREPFFQRVDAFRRSADDVGALRQRLGGGRPQLVDRLVAEFEQAVRRLAGQAWEATKYEGSRVEAAVDLFEQHHAKLVDTVVGQLSKITEAEQRRARADKMVSAQLHQFEAENGHLHPEARKIAHIATQLLGMPKHPDLGDGAVQALHGQFGLAAAYSRFLADLPAGAPEAVRREGLDAYIRLLAEPTNSVEQLDQVLTMLAGQARRQISVEKQLAASMSKLDRLSKALGSVPADDERTTLEGFLRARVDEEAARLVGDIRARISVAHYAPALVDAELSGLDVELNRAAERWADNEALRALARIDEGRDFLREPGIDGLDKILSALAGNASPPALASLLNLLAALPSMGAEAAAVVAILENVDQFLNGEADAYKRAFDRAADVRKGSRAELMEFVRSLRVLNPAMVELGDRIMDC
ncbi:hypothetical protein [Micromonospora sp. NPDC049102]|uniref:hypothetical protein n=1 Tax=Micromonospora sp. NPDC049102 TaxID=3364265 RepID=UPI0037182320